MEVHENRFAVLCDLDGDNDDDSLSSQLAKKAAAKLEAATGKQKQQKKKNPKAAAVAVAVAGAASAASGSFPSRPVPPSQHAKNFRTAAPPTEHGRGTGSNNDHWINSKKKNQSTGGRSNTGFPAYGKEETGTSATNSDSSTSRVHDRSAGDFPGNKTVEQANDDDNQQLTFAEYKKSIQEKRKAIEALKTEERKVTVEDQFEGMHLITGKKKEDGLQVNMQKSGKNKAKKDGFEKEKMVCKTVSIGRFQIPAKEETARRGRHGGHRGGNCAGGRGRQAAAIPRTQDAVDFPPLRPAADAAANF